MIRLIIYKTGKRQNMASEYLKKKYSDVRPEEKRELTKQEKWKNWWYYSKWKLLFSLICFIIAGDLILTMTGVLKPKFDLTVGVVSSRSFSEEEQEKIAKAFSNIIDDFNGDNKKTVQVQTYVINRSSDAKEHVSGMYGEELTLIADVDGCTSFLFVMDDPQTFQNTYGILCRPDGEVGDDVIPWDECVYLWKDIMPEGMADMNSMYIARRGFWTSKTSANGKKCAAFWQELTSK